MRIDLNADLGESFGPWPMGDDTALLDTITSANVACGMHAGDPLVMRRTVDAASARGVAIGAHPGFPDLQGFGRRAMAMVDDELAAFVQYQIGALQAITTAAGSRVTHVKPHGALNNLACENPALARTVVDAIVGVDRELVLLAPVFSALADAGAAAGLQVALEVFADRAYTEAGHLVPRAEPGAVHATSEDCIRQVLAMLEHHGVVTLRGTVLPTEFHSICVHGDSVHAVETASRIRAALHDAGHELASFANRTLADRTFSD